MIGGVLLEGSWWRDMELKWGHDTRSYEFNGTNEIDEEIDM